MTPATTGPTLIPKIRTIMSLSFQLFQTLQHIIEGKHKSYKTDLSQVSWNSIGHRTQCMLITTGLSNLEEF